MTRSYATRDYRSRDQDITWTKENVKQLLLLFDYYMKAARLGRTQRKGALKTINRCWGLEVIGFFRSHNESEKTLRQLAHLASNCFPYREVQRLINTVVVERLLTGVSRHLSR